jgi:UDP-N-acetylmuramate: L-alanyl-gamma-D-glutamyl-meso-diaminopimelate ligase
VKVYFLGICGTAMGQSALLARSAGHEVLGSDKGVYPPMSTVLREAGIEVHEGYDALRLERLKPDLVVVGNALSRGNPEVEWLLETRAIRKTSLPAMLHELVLVKRRNLVVAGTHGKTTTTALAAFLLRESGRDPGFLIGGVPLDPPVGSWLGSPGDPFVIEGDEYDSAFFDKRSKFVHYAPRIAVLNNLEFDHADIFRDLADVQRSFGHFVRLVPRGGWVVMNGDDANLKALGPMPWTQVLKVGTGEGNDLRIAGYRAGPEEAVFALHWGGKPWAEVKWNLPGLYNARNAAMAAAAVSLAVGPGGPVELPFAALTRFRGVKRRQEVLFSGGGLTVVEDFGHHPTALAETIEGLKERYPGALLTAAFEPRSNTARGKALEPEFRRALGRADEIYLGAVSRSERLAPGERFDTDGTARELAGKGRTAESFADSGKLLEALVRRTLPAGGRPRVVVFFTNGSFDGIIGRYVAAARGADPTGPSGRP